MAYSGAYLTRPFAAKQLPRMLAVTISDTPKGHFKDSLNPHPLSTSAQRYEHDDEVAGDHMGRQQNHIWTKG